MSHEPILKSCAEMFITFECNKNLMSTPKCFVCGLIANMFVLHAFQHNLSTLSSIQGMTHVISLSVLRMVKCSCMCVIYCMCANVYKMSPRLGSNCGLLLVNSLPLSMCVSIMHISCFSSTMSKHGPITFPASSLQI